MAAKVNSMYSLGPITGRRYPENLDIRTDLSLDIEFWQSSLFLEWPISGPDIEYLWPISGLDREYIKEKWPISGPDIGPKYSIYGPDIEYM
jgi:hypothetical protein